VHRLPVLLAIPVVVSTSIHAQDAPPFVHDSVDAATYDGWKQYSLQCARCHGDDALGTSFGPNLVASLRSDGTIPSREAFLALLASGRPDKGMPAAATLGLDQKYFDGIYEYLSGRSAGRFRGGRPVRKGK
jgi:mono/diheme cytochrome c family protein